MADKHGKKKYRLKRPKQFVKGVLVCVLIIAVIALGIWVGCLIAQDKAEAKAKAEAEARNHTPLSEDLSGRLEALALAMMDINRENYEQDPELPPSEARKAVGYNYCLVICPGHGGIDPGSVNSELGILEKDVNLSMALAIRDYIEDHATDIKVVMSRTDDTLLSYQEQRVLAEEQEADFCLMVHMNSYGGAGSAYGAEAMYPTNADAETVARSAEAAARLTAALAEALDTQDRGLSKDNDMDGIGLMMPAALVEFGFLSDNTEVMKLVTPETRDAAAAAAGAVLIELIHTYPIQETAEEAAQ